MAQYIITKRASGVFDIVKDSDNPISSSNWAVLRYGDFLNYKTENGAKIYRNVFYTETTVIDETSSGTQETFASALELHIRLVQLGFFDGGVSTPGESGVDTFKELLDTPSTFIGYNGQVPIVNEAMNRLEFSPFYNIRNLVELLDVQNTPISAQADGNILRLMPIIENGVTVRKFVSVPFPTQLNTPINMFTELGTTTVDGNEITVSEGYLWIINGTPTGNTSPFITEIEPADTGDSRIDIIVANIDGTFEKIEGNPSAGSGNAVAPIPNQDQLLLTTIYIYEDTVSEPTIPVTDGQYVNKLEYQYQAVIGSGSDTITDFPLNGINSALDIVSGVSRLDSVSITSSYSLYKGKELAIRNSQLSNVEITNGMGFNFHNGEDFTLLPGQVIKFKEYGLQFDFMGTFGGSETTGVQTVTAGNPLAVNNSDPLNPVLNVTTPADVDTKIAAITTSVVPEGSRLYFTESRVLATILAGLNTALTGSVINSDSILNAFGKIQNSLNSLTTAVGLRELLSNKSDNGGLGTSTSLYPTQRAVKQYVDSTVGRSKIIVFDNNAFPDISSTTATLARSYSIPANTIPANSLLRVTARSTKVGVAGTMIMYVNFDDNPNNSPLIQSVTSSVANYTFLSVERHCSVKNGQCSRFATGGAYYTDILALNAAYTPYTLDVTQPQTIYFKMSGSNAADVIKPDFLMIESIS